MSTNSPIAQDKPRRLPSDAELMALPRDGYKRELLNGEIITSPAGFDHGRRIMRFSTVFAAFVYQHNLGEVFDGQTGFRMSNGDVLSPDISFVSRARMLQTGQRDEGFFEGSPDLAIELLSPGDSPKRLKEKLAQYFENGTRLAWVMDSRRRIVSAHHGLERAAVLEETDELSGEDVVHGFRIAVAAVFAGMEYRS
jgi:Uma2 family endonuclease